MSHEAKQCLTSILSPQAGRGGVVRSVGPGRRREKAAGQFSFEFAASDFRRERVENICFKG